MILQRSAQNLQRATQIKQDWQEFLLAQPNVVGVGVGLRQGGLCIVLLVSQPTRGLPREVGGVKVLAEVSGPIVAALAAEGGSE